MSDYEWHVGQEVERCSTGWSAIGDILTVERLTPSGLPVVNGRIYRKDGNPRGNGRWSREWIKPLTPERKAEIHEHVRLGKARETMRALMGHALKNLSADQAEAVVAILREKLKEAGGDDAS